MRWCLIIPAVLLGCASYDPPVQGDHTAEKYQTDLRACRTSSAEKVRLKNADTLWTWLRSPFTGPPEVRADIRTCMAGKGYALDRAGG